MHCRQGDFQLRGSPNDMISPIIKYGNSDSENNFSSVL